MAWSNNNNSPYCLACGKYSPEAHMLADSYVAPIANAGHLSIDKLHSPPWPSAKLVTATE